MKAVITRTLLLGLGEAGLKAITATRRLIGETFADEPPVVGLIGFGIEENPTPGLHAGEYFRIRPASDRAQVRSIFREEYSMAVQPVLVTAFNRVSNALSAEGKDWMLSESNKVRVHLAFSLSDVVGTGLCIDIAYLLKVLFGSNITLSMHAVFTGLSEPCGKRHAANAYATLLDLDYLVSTVDADHPYRLELPYDTFTVGEPPMSAFFLVGSGEHAVEDLGADLFSLSILSEATSTIQDNMSTHLSDGSMDIEDKPAWITQLRAATYRLPVPFSIEDRKALLEENVEDLAPTTVIDPQGYNNAPLLYRRMFIAGPEDELDILQNDPDMSARVQPEGFSAYRPFPTALGFQQMVLIRVVGVFPAFQMAGWENELAYQSYEDKRPFHFDAGLYDLMRASRFSLSPLVSITEDMLMVWIKGRVLGLVPEGASIREAYANRRELRVRIAETEKAAPDKTDAAYETLRHLTPETLQAGFPCPDTLAEAALHYCNTRL